MILSDHTTCTKPEPQQRTKRIESEEQGTPHKTSLQVQPARNKPATNGKVTSNVTKNPNRPSANSKTAAKLGNDSASSTAAIRILKSYYNKDALASVNESLLNLDEEKKQRKSSKHPQAKASTSYSCTSSNGCVGGVDVHGSYKPTTINLKHLPPPQGNYNNNANPTESPSTSSSYSLSSNSTNHKLLDAEQQSDRNNVDSERLSINRLDTSSSFSCVRFVNQLVEGRLGDQINTTTTANLDVQQQEQEEDGSESSLSANKERIFEQQQQQEKTTEEEEQTAVSERATSTKRLNFNLDLVRKKKASLIKRFSNKSSSNTSSINSECTTDNGSTLTAVDAKKPPPNQQDIVQIGVKLISKLLNNTSGNTSNTTDSIDAQSNQTQTGKDTMYPNTTLKRLNANQPVYHQQQHNNHHHHHHHKPANLLSKKLRKSLPFNYGLKNHGNTCFMNCILQSLFHTSPLSDFFLTHQFEHDIKQILSQQQQQQQHKTTNGYSNSYTLNPYQHTSTNSTVTKPVMNQFILTRHFHRLLTSMWQNTYEAAYSAELKQLIGYINPVFAGVNQNDSHEFCIWLLDRLSQELTYKYTSVRDVATSNNDRSQDSEEEEEEEENEPSDDNETVEKVPSSKKRPSEPQNCSFIEDLFKIKFKSTVVCSKCNYRSSKYETDMMLSLPLPQQGQLRSKQAMSAAPGTQAMSSVRQFERRSFYFNLILSNQTSMKAMAANGALISSIITSQSSSSTSSSSTSSSSSSAFLNGNLTEHQMDYHEPHRSKFYITETSLDNPITSDGQSFNLQAPLHIKIAVNANLTTDNSTKRELINETTTSPTSSTFTVINPNFNDLRLHIESSYKLNKTNLVFVDLNHVDNVIFDEQSIKQYHRSSSLVALELVHLPANSQTPFINIISTNVYQQPQQQQGSKKSLTYGLPFAVLINRDCSYSELCQKLLEAQSKYLKDKNMLKYKELAVKMFTLSLYDVNTRQCEKLNSTDELPLYAECVDKALNESVKLGNHDSNTQLVEHIRINIEWRSYDDISNFFREVDYTKAEYVHKTVKQLQRMDENDQVNPTVFTYETNYPSCQQSTTNSYSNMSNQSQSSNITTLNDCFELFTQCEELTDENSWTCTKCKKQTNAYKKLGISSVPPILIIHLKRFFYKSKTSNFKLTTPVWFPVSNLDMSKYLSENGSNICNKENEQLINMNHNSDLGADCVESRTQPNRFIYDLFAVCNHKGQNMANGHYTAYCKNTIDTRWYCFDDSNCSPLYDTNNVNIHNTGSSYVCTENAYILFYKKRECLRNERWWVNYIDRSLFDYDEFEHFLSQLNAIERQQHATQSQQQQKFLQSQSTSSPYPSCSSSASSTCSTSGNSQTTFKTKTNGLRSIKDKILGNTNPQAAPRAGMYDWERAEYDSIEPVSGGYMCDREFNRQAERQRQEQILNSSSSRNNLINLDSHQIVTPAVVNHYDEYNKPKRLLKKNSSKEFQPPIVNQHQQTSATSTPSTTSSNHDSSLSYSSSYNRLSGSNDKNLMTFQDPVIQQIDNLSKEINKQVNLNNNDFIYDYPNDNEYIATSVNPKVTPRARKSTDYGQYGSQTATTIYSQPAYYSPTSYLQFQPSPVYHHQLRQKQLLQQQQIQHQQSVTPESHRSAGQSTPPSNSSKSSSRYINPASIETPI